MYLSSRRSHPYRYNVPRSHTVNNFVYIVGSLSKGRSNHHDTGKRYWRIWCPILHFPRKRIHERVGQLCPWTLSAQSIRTRYMFAEYEYKVPTHQHIGTIPRAEHCHFMYPTIAPEPNQEVEVVSPARHQMLLYGYNVRVHIADFPIQVPSFWPVPNAPTKHIRRTSQISFLRANDVNQGTSQK